MTFAWPHLLWLLLVPAALLVWDMSRRRWMAIAPQHPKILRAEMGPHDISLVRDGPTENQGRTRPWLAIGIAFAVIALARPQWGRIDEPVFDQSREILLALDLSRSMLSTDVKPSRLERSKLLIQALLEKLKGERVGLVVFSGTGFLQSPLSADYEILQEFLPSLGPDYLPEGGTNYSALLDTAIEAFGNSTAADRFLIILSDGEATDSDWKSRVDELKKKGIRVIGLGVGTTTGSMIPDGSGAFVKDERGAVVLSKLESGTLEQLAQATNGVYRDASAWIDLAGLVDQTVNAGRKGSFVEKTSVRYVDRFQWPLALALWCFMVSLYYEFPVRPRTRQMALNSRTEKDQPAMPSPIPSTTAKVATLFLLVGTLGLVRPLLHAAVKIAPPASNPPASAAAPASNPQAENSHLGRVVERLSAQDALTAPDLSELAHETLNWGQRIKDAGQPVPEGPVRDALTAVARLQAQGDTLADWAKLRKELEDLLQKPPEQKPPPQKQNQQQNQQDQKKDQQKSDSKPQPTSPQRQNESQPQNQQQQSNQNQNAPNQPSQPEKPAQPAFGEMKQKPSPPPNSAEMQKVGGAQDKKDQPAQPTDPALAVPLEKLDQLKNQDSPAQLFELMQSDRSQGTRKKPAKDW